jgi:hypothetical protein
MNKEEYIKNKIKKYYETKKAEVISDTTNTNIKKNYVDKYKDDKNKKDNVNIK